MLFRLNKLPEAEEKLRAALEFDRLATAGKPRHQAVREMRQSGLFPDRLVSALESAEIQGPERIVIMRRVNELNATMVANQDICTSKGLLLLQKGADLTLPRIEMLRGFAKTAGIPQPLSVLVPFAPHPSSA